MLAFALLLVGGLLSTAGATALPAQAQESDDDGAGDDDDGAGDDGVGDDDDDGMPGNDGTPDDDDGAGDDDDGGTGDDDGSPAPAPGRTKGRLEGPNRITTAVAISQFQFPQGADVVFLANANSFADAVAGGSLTGGPILLVPQCGELPAPVAAEIRRLAPARVVALGGAQAVCEGIVDAALAA